MSVRRASYSLPDDEFFSNHINNPGAKPNILLINQDSLIIKNEKDDILEHLTKSEQCGFDMGIWAATDAYIRRSSRIFEIITPIE